MIVKLANIQLTPEKPQYDGGSWHVEGSMNEHIVATILYYYDNDNLTNSHLAFREEMSIDLVVGQVYEQHGYGHLERLYDVEMDGPAVQPLAKVLTKQGRVLVFPNVLQHRVEPFGLVDTTRPGHRKILALFVVDPNLRIPSSANVPPQQKEWWSELAVESSRLKNLPTELADHVIDAVDDFPIGLEEAKELRLLLMKERKVHDLQVDVKIHDATFNFCEH